MLDNIQLPAPGQIAVVTLICTALLAFFYKDTIYKKALKKIAPVTNAAMDMYLDHKYKGVVKKLDEKTKDDVKVYKLLDINLYSMNENQMVNIPKKPNLETCLENSSLDLNISPNKIMCNKILAHLWDVGYEIKKMNIYGNLKYQYGDKTYTYCFECITDRQLSLPIYDVDDLESCLETQYSTAHITLCHKDEKNDVIEMADCPKGNFYSQKDDKSGKFYKVKDDVFDVIKMAAGPKGNFYSDKEDQITPNQIIELSCMKATDWLILTTTMGDNLVFNKHDKMLV